MAKIILRLDLNVPIQNNKIQETLKIDVILNDLKKLLKNNQVTVLSHLGKGEKGETLAPIEKYVRKKLTKNENTNLTVLENIRFLKGETAPAGSLDFQNTTKYFASFGDVYVDDAFSVMHRKNASVVGIPKLFKQEGKEARLGNYAKEEIKNLTKFLTRAKDPKNKTLLILGGVKLETKLPLIKKFLALDCRVFLGGGNANQVLKDILNLEIGKSYYEENFKWNSAEKKYLREAYRKGNLLLPSDTVLKNEKIKSTNSLKKSDYICDVGPSALKDLKKEVQTAKTIILNGPLGIYNLGFTAGTLETLKLLKKSTIPILIGGGDTLVLVEKLKMHPTKNIYISTAGGAMLEFLTHDGKLPGILAVE